MTPTSFTLLALDANGKIPVEALPSVAVDNYSLDAADGSPSDAVYVDNDGNVRVGTAGTADYATRQDRSSPTVSIPISRVWNPM